MAKQYIAECRKNGNEPNRYDYLRMLKYKLDIENVYYNTENNENVFEKKWTLLYECLWISVVFCIHIHE